MLETAGWGWTLSTARRILDSLTRARTVEAASDVLAGVSEQLLWEQQGGQWGAGDQSEGAWGWASCVRLCSGTLVQRTQGIWGPAGCVLLAWP